MTLPHFLKRIALTEADKKKIRAMAVYLAEIHAMKKDSKTLYWRKLRDTIGHGECLMGVFDTYPDGVLSYEEMADIIKKSVDWYAKLKPRYQRLSQIHGDFHPGNIWFTSHDTETRDTETRRSSIRSPHCLTLSSSTEAGGHGENPQMT